MAFPSSTLSGSICGSPPDSLRGFWPDNPLSGEPSSSLKPDNSRVKWTPQRKVVYGFNSSAHNPDSSPSPSSSFSDEWWRKHTDKPGCCQPVGFWAESRGPGATHFVGEKLFDFPAESSSQLPAEKEYIYHETPTSRGASGGVPVYVMLPLDSVNPNNTLNRPRAMNASLRALKSAGVEGIMVDVWWGIVEKGPTKYNWAGYRELMDMARKHGLKVQAVMSFHQCGGNVGDSCWIPLPPWVTEEIDLNPDLVYTDREGRRNYEYLSLGADTLPVLKGRSPVQVYTEFMRSFRDEFQEFLGEVIVEIQVGLGPAGELRYPAYPESNNTWQFPGVGEFQCYDKYLAASLKASAESVGEPKWGEGGPHNAGHYKQFPDETGFFHREGAWNTSYGQFFLKWYSGMLLEHGERILSSAENIFRGTGSKLSGKVAGIHWHYGTRSHSPELTAGYFNTRSRDGYLSIAQMFGRHGVTLNFTCFEMKDEEQQPSCARCSPEGLLKQVTLAARKASVPLAGENALVRFDEGAHHQIIRNSRLTADDDEGWEASYEPMCSFTFLRMSEQLFHSDNWHGFVQFVRQMAEGRTFQPWEDKHHDTVSHVHATKPLMQEAEAAMMCK